MPERYIGAVVEMIYMDRKGTITQRKIEVRRIGEGLVKAFCFKSGQLRTFKIDQILAVNPVQIQKAAPYRVFN